MDKARSPLIYASWVLYLVGTALFLGSYFGFVPLGIAWCGWVAGIAGWALGAYVNRPDRT